MDTTNPAPPIASANSGNVNKNAVRKWTWTIVRLVILAFLITGVMDVIIVAGRSLLDTVQKHRGIGLSDPIEQVRKPEESDYSPYTVLTTVADLASKPIVYKRLHLDVDPNGVSASYDVYLPKDHPLFEIVETDNGPTHVSKLAHEVLGAVTVDEQLLTFEQVTTSIDATDSNAHFYVTSSRFQPSKNKYWIHVHDKQLPLNLSIGSKEVNVHTRDSNVHSGWSLNPVSKTPDDTVYILPADKDKMYFVVQITKPTVNAVGENRRTLASILETPLRIPGLDLVVYGVLSSLPFLLFLYWNKQTGFANSSPASEQKVKAVKTYLVFHFSYYFFYALSDLIGDWQNPFRLALNFIESRTLYVFNGGIYHTSYLMFPMMAMFIYVWPLFAPVSRSDGALRRGRVRARGAQIISLLLVLALIIFIGWFVAAQFEEIGTNVGLLSVIDFYLLFFAVALVVLYVLCLLLAYAARRPARLQFAFGLFILLVVLAASDVFYGFAHSRGTVRNWNGAISWLLFGVSAFFIVRSFLSIFYQAITGRPLQPDWTKLSVKKRLLLNLMLLAIALSTRSWAWPMVYWPLWSLVWELKGFFLIALVWILADFLYRVSVENDWLSLPESARDAGILLALSLFYSPTPNRYYIPVSFITGAVLLRFWLLPHKQFDRSVFSQVKSGMIRMIERVIAFNDAERALKTLKKELLVKLGKGEIEPHQYAERLQVQAKTVKSLKQELTIHKKFAKDLVLAFGPGNSAWENGKNTAYYSLLFAVPWSVLYLRNIVRAPAASDTYLLLDLVNNATFFALAWLSYGFIFGYFYPHIRGNNGIQKGLALFLTIVIPELVWTALALPLDGANWASVGFWALQIFVQTMLLGMVAGDFAIMRAHGFRWGHLLEFHKIASLSAWASSIILAVAAAASTLLTSGATQILTSAFKFIGVIPENVDLPTK